MRNALSACLALLLAASAVPAFAGTVYVPILTDNGVDDTEYLTRIWLTNEGNAPLTVETLFLPNNTDGTEGRDEGQKNVNKTSVPAGQTRVIAFGQRPGLLEISTEGDGAGNLAVNAEVRIPDQPAAEAIYSPVPVLSSENVTEAGGVLTLQGLRRTEGGVVTNVSIVNLGHEEAQCSAKVFRPGGNQIASTALLTLKALSQVQFADALAVLGEKQIQDVHAQISCDQSFFAYLTKYAQGAGDILVVQPSVTGDSSLFRPGQDTPSVPGAVLFTRKGTFHTPTPGNPTKIFNIAVPGEKDFGNVVVDFDFFHAGWFSADPDENHSLFWLHRGACCWPKWKGNITSFANAFGPGKNQVKMVSNMNLSGFEKSKGQTNVSLQQGRTYHLHFEYDTNTGVSFMEITDGGNRVAYVTMSTTVSRLRPDSSAAWMIYFGHENAGTHGPERPTYGWKYQDLRVEFIP